jgi:hypothetical protein
MENFQLKIFFEQVKMDDAGLIACKVGCTYIYLFIIIILLYYP